MQSSAAKKIDWNYLYHENFGKYGVSPRTMLRDNEVTQSLSYEAVRRSVGPHMLDGSTILDVGCGFGGLALYLVHVGIIPLMYRGIDPVKEFIDVTKERFGYVHSHYFDVGTLSEVSDRECYDYVVALGVLDTKDILSPLTKRMWSLANKAIVFTCLNKRAVCKSRLISYSPERVVNTVSHLSESWNLDFTYGNGEFCVAVYKEGAR